MLIQNKDASKDAPLIGMEHPKVPGFKLVAKNKHISEYHKTCPYTFLQTYLRFNHATKIEHGKILPKVIAETQVRLNKIKQNNFDGYKGKEMVQLSGVPQMLHQQIKEQSGLEHRTGLYDKKKYAAILDDRDNKYLKTVPHKISNRKREI